MGPQKKKKKKRQISVDFGPSKLCCLAFVCVCWTGVSRKGWAHGTITAFCRIKSKTFKWEAKRKKKKIYFCTKVILSLACVLLFCGLSYMEKLTQRGKRQSRFTVREVELLAPWLPSPFLCHFQPVAAGRECLFLLLLPIFKKKGDIEFLSFVLCGLFSDVLSRTEKKNLIKKYVSWTDFCAVMLQMINSALPNVQKRILLTLRLWLSTRNKVKLLIEQKQHLK